MLVFHPGVVLREAVFFMQGDFACVADISGVFTLFCEPHKISGVSVDIYFIPAPTPA
jgi:hypothetical protein